MSEQRSLNKLHWTLIAETLTMISVRSSSLKLSFSNLWIKLFMVKLARVSGVVEMTFGLYYMKHITQLSNQKLSQELTMSFTGSWSMWLA